MIDHFVELPGGHLLGARKIRGQAGVQVAGAGAHDQSRGWGEAHAGVDAFSVADCRHAGAVAEVGQDHPALRRRGIAEPRQFLHQIGIR